MIHQSNPINAYMQEIAQTPLITLEEEVSLGATVQAGIRATKCRDNAPELEPTKKLHLANLARQGEEAQQTLIKANLRLVVKIAQKFKGLGLSLQDLISEGNLGLMVAAEKFDPLKGAKFSSYAAWWIKQAMRRALSEDARVIKIPVNTDGKRRSRTNSINALAQALGRKPSDVEISEHLDLSDREIRTIRQATCKIVNLSDSPPGYDDMTYAELLASQSSTGFDPATYVEMIDADLSYNEATKILNSDERTVIAMKDGRGRHKPHSYEQIGKIINKTPARVQQIYKAGKSKIHRYLNGHDTQDYPLAHYKPSELRAQQVQIPDPNFMRSQSHNKAGQRAKVPDFLKHIVASRRLKHYSRKLHNPLIHLLLVMHYEQNRNIANIRELLASRGIYLGENTITSTIKKGCKELKTQLNTMNAD